MEVNHQGASLHAVIETNPKGLQEAAALDHERKVSGARSALHGIPILVKDNIATIAEEGAQHHVISYVKTRVDFGD